MVGYSFIDYVKWNIFVFYTVNTFKQKQKSKRRARLVFGGISSRSQSFYESSELAERKAQVVEEPIKLLNRGWF